MTSVDHALTLRDEKSFHLRRPLQHSTKTSFVGQNEAGSVLSDYGRGLHEVCKSQRP